MLDKSIIEAAEALGLELDWLVELSEEIPRDGRIPVNEAARKKVQFWSAITTLTDWLTVARRAANEAKSDRDQYLAAAKKVSEEKTEAGKTREAESNPKYQEYCRKRLLLDELRQYLEAKRGDFVMAHYLCKGIVTEAIQDKDSTPAEEASVTI